MERITTKTRLGPKLATLVCPKCQQDAQPIFCLRNLKARTADCSNCDIRFPLLDWFIRRG